MMEFDAADAHMPEIGPVNVLWIDLVDPVTGEVATIDAADGGPYGNGETFTIQWSSSGIWLPHDL